MRRHTLTVLGQEVSFKAETDPGRVERARALLEERYELLARNGGHLSKEKLLTFLALALADDLVNMKDEWVETEERVLSLLVGIDEATKDDV
jgi:cell division protein ZapA